MDKDSDLFKLVFIHKSAEPQWQELVSYTIKLPHAVLFDILLRQKVIMALTHPDPGLEAVVVLLLEAPLKFAPFKRGVEQASHRLDLPSSSSVIGMSLIFPTCA